MSKSLTDKTLSGINWSFLNTYSNAVITTVVGIVLARLLLPQDFGLIGMVVIFTGLADLFATLGMGKSIIRIKNVNEDHIKIATTVTMCSSILIFVIFYFTAPAISEFYHEQRLIPILRVLSVIFILKGVSTVSFAQIMKSLDFKTIMIINISTSVAYGCMSASLAFLGFGVWSLVYGRITSQILSLILSVYKYPVNLKPSIKKKEFKELAGFGSGVSFSNILFYGTSNIDYLIIGKFMNPVALGLYTRAFNLVSNTMDSIAGGIYNVLFPVLSAVQNEKEKLRKAYLRTIQTTTYFIFPVYSSMLVLSEYIIGGLYGEKWLGAVPPLRILLIAGFFRVTIKYSGAAIHAVGRVYADVIRQLTYFLVLGISAYFLIKFNIVGVAIAVLIARIWMFFTQNQLAIKIINSSWKEFLIKHIPAIANSAVMFIINVVIVLFIEIFLNIRSNEIKLIISIVLNIPLFLLTIVLIPSFIKGDTFDWLLKKYERFVPYIFQKFYYSINKK